MYGLLRAKSGHPGVEFRHVIGPNRDMPNKVVPVEFTVDEVKKQLYQGKKDAQSSIETYKELNSGSASSRNRLV
jgi:hypothetical protein